MSAHSLALSNCIWVTRLHYKVRIIRITDALIYLMACNHMYLIQLILTFPLSRVYKVPYLFTRQFNNQPINFTKPTPSLEL